MTDSENLACIFSASQHRGMRRGVVCRFRENTQTYSGQYLMRGGGGIKKLPCMMTVLLVDRKNDSRSMLLMTFEDVQEI